MNRLYAVQFNTDKPDLIQEVYRLSDSPDVFKYIPLHLMHLDDSQLFRLESFPQVLDIRPFYDDDLKIIYGFNSLIKYGILAWNNRKPNGWIDDYRLGQPPEKLSRYPAYPVVDFSTIPPVYNIDINALLSTRLGHMSVINLSLGPPENTKYDDLDPVVVAIKTALKYVNIVIAAGNDGPYEGSMNPWSLTPGAISVGATDSATGGDLLQDSSRGYKDRPTSGPTVVAYGKSAIPPYHLGTSYAAARVSGLIPNLAAFCLTLNYFVNQFHKRQPQGIPLVGYGLIDKEILPEKRQLAISALPRTGINIKLLTEVLSLFQDLDLHINETEPTTYRLRKMLIKSAETMPGYEGQDVGHGFVSKETTQNFLENFTATQLASIFCEGYTEELKLKEEVFHRSLVEPNTIGHLMDIWTMSQRRWPFDFERCKPSVLRKN